MRQERKKFISRAISLILTAVLTASVLPSEGWTVRASEEEEAIVLPKKPQAVKNSNMEAGKKVTWDCVWFGSYPQSEVTEEDPVFEELQRASGWSGNEITIDEVKYRRIRQEDATYVSEDGEAEYYSWPDETSYHYFRYEKIKWRVLDISGTTAFLMADVALDGQKYNQEEDDVTWESCTLRTWLNGGTDRGSFRNSAFSSEEQAALRNTSVANEDNSYYETPGGNVTADQVYLLSESEVCAGEQAVSYGFSGSEETIDEARRAKSSDYAKAMGIYTEISEEDYQGNCHWLLRTPGVLSSYVGNVDYDGYVDLDGVDVDGGYIAVRPVLRMDLSDSSVWSRAGSVCSDGTVLEESESIFVQQHIDYIQNGSYQSDIVKGFGGMLQDTLSRVKKDKLVTGYHVADKINDALNYKLDMTQQYEVVLAQLMVNDQSYQGIQESFLNNVWEEGYKAIELLLKSCDGTADLVKADAVSTLKYLYKQVGKTNFSAKEYAEFYERSGKLIDRKINVQQAKKVFEKIDLGYSIADVAVTTASQLLEYIAWGNAYVNTVEEFKDVLGMMYVQADYCFWYESDGTLEHLFDTSSLQAAILEFVSGMEAYKSEGAAAVAKEGVGKLASNTGSLVASRVTDFILKKVPIFHVVPILKAALETGLTVVDLFTSVDDRAYNGDMLVKMYYLDIIMADALKGNIADGFEQMLFRSRTFENAKKFDEAMNIYKTAHMLSCEFAVGYLEAVSADAILNRTKLENATYISALYAQQMQYRNIKCHEEGVPVFTGETILSYTPREQLQVVTVACPVTVTVRDESGKEFAVLSSEKVTVRKGYRHYCFTMGREKEIKAAIIPASYRVEIEGTGNGTMDVWTGTLNGSVVTAAAGTEKVPVSTATRANLSFASGKPVLVSDGKNYEIRTEQNETPVVPQNPGNSSGGTVSKKKGINKLKVTAKKGKKQIVVQTIAGAKVKVSMQKKYIRSGKKKVKTMTVSAGKNKKGKITIKLSEKLKKGMKIKVTVSKTGYQTRTKSVKAA